jgi:tetratricopeptide (TPR) repeat protein
VLGRRHLQVATASTNLAACLHSQGSYHAAARLYTAALEVRRASLGDTAADTALCLHSLGLCHARLGEWARAEGLFREALAARVAALGQLHPDVAVTAHQLGHCLGQQGQHTEALVYHKQGLWVRQQAERHAGGAPASPTAGAGADPAAAAAAGRRSSGSGAPSNPLDDLASSHRCVALCLSRLGCEQQAEEHLGTALEMQGAVLAGLHPPPPPGAAAAGGTPGGRHSRSASAASPRAARASGPGRGSSGGSGGGPAPAGLDDVDWGVLAEGDSRLSKAQAGALLAMASAAEDMGRCLSRQGKHARAEECYWRALEARSQVLGSRHELVVETEEQLRNCLEQQC